MPDETPENTSPDSWGEGPIEQPDDLELDPSEAGGVAGGTYNEAKNSNNGEGWLAAGTSA